MCLILAQADAVRRRFAGFQTHDAHTLRGSPRGLHASAERRVVCWLRHVFIQGVSVVFACFPCVLVRMTSAQYCARVVRCWSVLRCMLPITRCCNSRTAKRWCSVSHCLFRFHLHARTQTELARILARHIAAAEQADASVQVRYHYRCCYLPL